MTSQGLSRWRYWVSEIWGGILDSYGPNRTSTDRFSVVCILDFTKIRKVFWGLIFTLFWENIIL